MEKNTPVHILLIDDDVIDREMVQRLFKKYQIANPLTCAGDAFQAFEILKGKDGTLPIPQPCIILLDINMPRMNGFQFLQEMRSDPFMRNNVVFMLTTSSGSPDRRLAYDLQAAGYFLKHNVSDFVEFLGRYCALNIFPSHAEDPQRSASL